MKEKKIELPFRLKGEMSLGELLDGGAQLVDFINEYLKKEGGAVALPHNEFVAIGEAYGVLETTYSQIGESGRPTLEEPRFYKIEKARHIQMLEGRLHYKGDGIYGLVDWVKDHGDEDCVIPLLKFGMSNHIIATDGRFWKFHRTNYVQRVNEAINDMSKEHHGVLDVLDGVYKEMKRALSDTEAFAKPGDYGTGVLYRTRSLYGGKIGPGVKRLRLMIHIT